MSSLRNYKIVRGPTWAGVIFAGAASVVLGGALGAFLLAFRPVNAGKEMPPDNERKPGEVYYVEGTRDTAKARLAATKRKAFLDGQSVTLSEDELNVMAGPAPAPKPAANQPKKGPEPKAAPPPPKSPAKKSGEPEKEVESFVRGTPNFRLRENDVQIAVPITVNSLGLGSVVTVRTHGQFTKDGDVFRYDISDMWVGALHTDRLPFVRAWAREKFLTQPLPEDLQAAWKKVAKITVGNGSLQLTVP
ncbi:MAG: hypothetical protein JNL39_19350 [Opitutaceae bacterium]|nr:hypothetical protein [Opitutaceae bacterium]